MDFELDIKEILTAAAIAKFLQPYILDALKKTGFNFTEVAEMRAFSALEEIKKALSKHETLDDFEIVEEIVTIFEKYDLNAEGCHDFG